MRRVAALAAFLIRDLHTTLPGVIPPALALGLFGVTFYYPVSPGYLSAVGGWDLAVVSLAVTILLADRANRASLYPLVGRLPRRLDLLAAVVVASMVVMLVTAVGFAGLAVAARRVSLMPSEAASIALRWPAVFLMVVCLGLHLSRLVSRRGSHVAAALFLAAAISAGSWRDLAGGASELLAGGLQAVTSPVGALLAGDAAGLDWPALVEVLAASLTLFLLAALLFRRKDLLWPE